MMLYMIIFACFACLVLGSPETNPLTTKKKRLVLVAVSILAAKYYETRYRKIPYHDSKMSELMRTRSTQRFLDVTRMSKCKLKCIPNRSALGATTKVGFII